jgi:hypothetical protein
MLLIGFACSHSLSVRAPHMHLFPMIGVLLIEWGTSGGMKDVERNAEQLGHTIRLRSDSVSLLLLSLLLYMIYIYIYEISFAEGSAISKRLMRRLSHRPLLLPPPLLLLPALGMHVQSCIDERKSTIMVVMC